MKLKTNTKGQVSVEMIIIIGIIILGAVILASIVFGLFNTKVDESDALDSSKDEIFDNVFDKLINEIEGDFSNYRPS
jgi:uncharacterized protein (UPF0333 family)